jgi:hypothetical protein
MLRASGEPRQPQGLLGVKRLRLGSGAGLLCRPMFSVKTPCDACGRTTPLQAAQACCPGQGLGLTLPPL